MKSSERGRKTTRNGTLAELHFQRWLVERGFEVALPVMASPVDVLWRAAPTDPWLSGQVKKVYWKAGANGDRHQTVDTARSGHQLYGPADCDYLVCVDYENGHVWLLRFAAVCDVKRLRLDKWMQYREAL